MHTEGYDTPLEIPGTWQNPRRGTFVQKFTEIASGDHTFRLEARVIADHGIGFPNDFIPNFYASSGVPGADISYGADAFIKLKNFNIFEALVDA